MPTSRSRSIIGIAMRQRVASRSHAGISTLSQLPGSRRYSNRSMIHCSRLRKVHNGSWECSSASGCTSCTCNGQAATAEIR